MGASAAVGRPSRGHRMPIASFHQRRPTLGLRRRNRAVGRTEFVCAKEASLHAELSVVLGVKTCFTNEGPDRLPLALGGFGA